MAKWYRLVSCDDVKDVAHVLRNVIHHAYKAEYVMPWPPTAHDIPLPDLTDSFATLTPTSSSMDDRHQILSISQGFCRDTTACL